MAIADYSTTPSDNTDLNGITLNDSTLPNALDNAFWNLMADLAAMRTSGTAGSPFTFTGIVNFSGGAQFSGDLLDVNGNEVVELEAVTNAVNHVKFINAASGNRPQLRSTGDEAVIGLNIDTKGDATVAIRTNNGERMTFGTSGVKSPTIYGDTTASSGNVFIDGSGYLKRSTSAAKYKTDIESESEWGDFIDAMQGISYAPADGSGGRFLGFLADDVAQLDARFVTYGPDGQIEGLMYDRLVVPLIEEVKALRARVTALEGN